MWSKIPFRYKKISVRILAVLIGILLPVNALYFYVNNQYEMTENEALYISNFNTALLALLAFLFGAWRGGTFLAVFSQDYQKYLILSPCSDEKKLICGRISLYGLDCLTLLFIMLPAFVFPVIHPLLPFIVFLGTYLAVIYLGFLITDHKELHVYTLIALILGPFFFYWGNNYETFLGILIVLYIAAMIGVNRFFKEFPWNTKYWMSDQINEWKKDALRKRIIRWPYRDLLQEVRKPFKLAGIGIGCGLLSWWLHLLLRRMEIGEDVFFFYYLSVFLIMMIRWGTYRGAGRPPISLWGRIKTGHWIIPGYDKILLPPVVIGIVGYLGPKYLLLTGIPKVLAYEMLFFTCMVLAFSLPPSMRKWKYTGPYQMSTAMHHAPSRRRSD